MRSNSRSIKLVRVMFVGLLAAALAACGGGSTQAPSDGSAAPAGSEASAPAAEASADTAGSSTGSETSADSGGALAELVEQARQEGSLTVTMQSSWDPALIPELTAGFKEFFDLPDLNVSITNTRAAEHFPVAIAETQAGAPPTFDAVQGDDAETAQLLAGGGIQPVENWEELLAEINSLVGSGEVEPSAISQRTFEGQAFLFMGNVKTIAYNTDLISPEDLPREHADLADPKYQGRFTQPPWTSHWEIAPAAIGVDRQEWLEVVRAAGLNSGEILGESTGVERVLLGQYDFGLAQDTYIRQTLAADPNAPLGTKPFEDFNEYNGVYYSVRTGTPHPAGATLFSLWMTTPEAQEIWQPSAFQGTPYGKSEIDLDQQRIIEEAGNVVGFMDTDETAELLDWFRSEEGSQYVTDLAAAIAARG